MLAQKSDIAVVRLEEDVEQRPHYGHTADHGIQRDIADHAGDHMPGYTVPYAVKNNIGRNQPRCRIADARQQSGYCIDAEAYSGTGNAPSRIQQMRKIVERFKALVVVVTGFRHMPHLRNTTQTAWTIPGT